MITHGEIMKNLVEIKILLRLASDLPKKPIIDFWPCLSIHYPCRKKNIELYMNIFLN